MFIAVLKTAIHLSCSETGESKGNSLNHYNL